MRFFIFFFGFLSIKASGQSLTYYNNFNTINYPLSGFIEAISIDDNNLIWASDAFGNLASFNQVQFDEISVQESKTGSGSKVFDIYNFNSKLYFVCDKSDTISETGGIIVKTSTNWVPYFKGYRSPIFPKNSTFDSVRKKIYFRTSNNFTGRNGLCFFDLMDSSIYNLQNSAAGIDTLVNRPDIFIPFNKNFYAYSTIPKISEIRLTNGKDKFFKFKLRDQQGRKKIPFNFFNTDSSCFFLIGLDSLISPDWSMSIFRCDTSGCNDVTQILIGDTTVIEAKSAPNGDIYFGLAGQGLIILKRNGKMIKVSDSENPRLISLSNFNFAEDGTKWFAAFGDLVRMTDVNCRFSTIQKGGCKGQTLSFASQTTTIGDGIKTYIWKFGNAQERVFSAKDGDTISYTFQSPGTYKVKLIAIDSNGIIDSAFQHVNILNSPGVQINALDSLVTCKNSVSLSTINGIKPAWYLPDGSTILGAQSIQASFAGLYVVRDTLTIDTVSCFSTDSVRIIRLGVEPASIEFSNSMDGNLLPDSIYRDEATSILVNGTPPGSPFSMLINGTDLQKNPAIIAVGELSKIEVSFSSMNQDSCQFSTTKTLIIKDKPIQPAFVPNLPNLVTANDDNVNERFTDKTGSFPSGFRLEIFNRWGKSIFKMDNYQNEWPEPETHEGLYFYLLSNPNGIKYSGWVEVMR